MPVVRAFPNRLAQRSFKVLVCNALSSNRAHRLLRLQTCSASRTCQVHRDQAIPTCLETKLSTIRLLNPRVRRRICTHRIHAFNDVATARRCHLAVTRRTINRVRLRPVVAAPHALNAPTRSRFAMFTTLRRAIASLCFDRALAKVREFVARSSAPHSVIRRIKMACSHVFHAIANCHERNLRKMRRHKPRARMREPVQSTH